MTEKKWLEIGFVPDMIDYLNGRVSLRKLHWFGAACCRRFGPLIPGPQRACVRIMDRWLLGSASVQELYLATGRMCEGWAVDFRQHLGDAKFRIDLAFRYLVQMLYNEPFDYVLSVVSCSAQAQEIGGHSRSDEEDVQAALLRDIVGNPYRKVALKPSWVTPAVKEVAREIFYKARFQDMPRLGRALEKAGCTNAEVLAHCRAKEPHVRGCWVVDQILGQDDGPLLRRGARHASKTARATSASQRARDVAAANRSLMDFFAAMNQWWKDAITRAGKRPQGMTSLAYHIAVLTAGHESLMRTFTEHCYAPNHVTALGHARGSAYFPVDRITERRTIRATTHELVFQLTMPEGSRGQLAHYHFHLRRRDDRWLVEHMKVRGEYTGF